MRTPFALGKGMNHSILGFLRISAAVLRHQIGERPVLLAQGGQFERNSLHNEQLLMGLPYIGN
jgi:hypothetical protein